MISGVRLKVCGLTDAAAAAAAARLGADRLGLIAHPASPRHLAPERMLGLGRDIGWGRVVVVSVSPPPPALRSWSEAGADAFQVHFPAETPMEEVRAWSEAVGPERLWLAPRLAPGARVREEWLPLAGTFLLDAFSADGFGGTGRQGDWEGFARERAAHPGKTWILSGGLKPENIASALERTGADFVDVNSGVESRPGVKDPALLSAFAAALRAAAARRGGWRAVEK